MDPWLEHLHHTILQYQLSNLPDEDALDEEVVVEVATATEVGAVAAPKRYQMPLEVVVEVATAIEVGAVAAPNCY